MSITILTDVNNMENFNEKYKKTHSQLFLDFERQDLPFVIMNLIHLSTITGTSSDVSCWSSSLFWHFWKRII